MALDQKITGPGTVRFHSGTSFFTDRKGHKRNIQTLSEALAKEAECGCGIECQCYGILVIKNWDSTTGTSEQYALGFVDGAMVTGTVESVQAAIDAAKNV